MVNTLQWTQLHLRYISEFLGWPESGAHNREHAFLPESTVQPKLHLQSSAGSWCTGSRHVVHLCSCLLQPLTSPESLRKQLVFWRSLPRTSFVTIL